MSGQTIDLRAESGGVEYTWPLTITAVDGADISDATIELSLGSYSDPGIWRAPDSDNAGPPSSRAVQLLIGATLRPAAGDYYLWSRISDNPEVAPRRQQQLHILNDI